MIIEMDIDKLTLAVSQMDALTHMAVVDDNFQLLTADEQQAYLLTMMDQVEKIKEVAESATVAPCNTAA